MGNTTTHGVKIDVTKLNIDRVTNASLSGISNSITSHHYLRNHNQKKKYSINVTSSCYISFDSENDKIIQSKMLNENNVQILKLYFNEADKKITIFEPEILKINFFEKTRLQQFYSKMFVVAPDNPNQVELNCGDIIQFNVQEGVAKKYLVREIVNESERIKFSAEPPKQMDNFDDLSIKNESCVYHNTESNEKKADHPCVYCNKLTNDSNNFLLYLCKNCEAAPIHNECLNNFVYENLQLNHQEFVTYFEQSEMFCVRCGNEYPKTFKYGEKKMQQLRFEDDPQCPYIILENIQEDKGGPLSKLKEKGFIKGMVVKFMGYNFVKLGGKKERSYSAEDPVLIGNSEDDSKNISCYLKFSEPYVAISDINSKWGIFVTKFNPPIIDPKEGNNSLKMLVQDHLQEIEYKKKLTKVLNDINLDESDGYFLQSFSRQQYSNYDENDIFDAINFLVTEKEPLTKAINFSMVKKRPA